MRLFTREVHYLPDTNCDIRTSLALTISRRYRIADHRGAQHDGTSSAPLPLLGFSLCFDQQHASRMLQTVIWTLCLDPRSPTRWSTFCRRRKVVLLYCSALTRHNNTSPSIAGIRIASQTLNQILMQRLPSRDCSWWPHPQEQLSGHDLPRTPPPLNVHYCPGGFGGVEMSFLESIIPALATDIAVMV